MHVIVDGLLTNYVTEGKGKAVLMLHGWGSSVEAFSRLIKELGNTNRVVALDLPGFGKSDNPKTAWSLGEYAEFVKQFLIKIKVQPEVIITHSNGCAIAIKGLAEGALETNKLVVMGGAGIRSQNKGKKNLLKVVAKTGKPLLFALPKNTRSKVRKKWYKSIDSELLLIPEMEETFKKITSEDVLADAAKVGCDTLLIYGEQDQSTPPLYGQLYFETMPSATLEIIADAGHFSFMDKPEIVIKLIKEFIG